MHQTLYAYMFTDTYGFNGIWVKCMGMGSELVKDRRINYDSKNDSKTECRFSSVHGLSRSLASTTYEFSSSAMVSEDEMLVHGGGFSSGFCGGLNAAQIH